eukprot:SAG22_NODE_2722_length_2280_cov_2.205410_1_plen_145_part_00
MAATKQIARKLKEDAHARTLSGLLGGISIGSAKASSIALEILRVHFKGWNRHANGVAVADSDEELDAMEDGFVFAKFVAENGMFEEDDDEDDVPQSAGFLIDLETALKADYAAAHEQLVTALWMLTSALQNAEDLKRRPARGRM